MAKHLLWTVLVASFLVAVKDLFTGDVLSDRASMVLFGSMAILAICESIEGRNK